MHKHDLSQGTHEWEDELTRRLSLFGHRNWIVIADAAYPAQSNPGIETVVADADQIQVMQTVLGRIATTKHIRINVYADLELSFVEENDAPGISEYRQRLDLLLNEPGVKRLPHEQIIAKLDQCANLFRILIIKTNLTIPYTAVFLELECGYWNADAEQRLRTAMRA